MNPIEQAKELVSLIQKIGDVDLYRKIVELQGEVVRLSARNVELEQKREELEAELRRKKSLRHVRSLYFADNDPIPFCPHCWETHACNNDYFGRGEQNFEASPNRRRRRL